jgi:hypothetical protein
MSGNAWVGHARQCAAASDHVFYHYVIAKGKPVLPGHLLVQHIDTLSTQALIKREFHVTAAVAGVGKLTQSMHKIGSGMLFRAWQNQWQVPLPQ